MSTFLRTCLLLTCLLAGSNNYANSKNEATIEPGSYQHGEQILQQNLSLKRITRKASGIILFVGDGMSITTATASRIRAGQLAGKKGEEHQLFFETLPHLGLSKTYNTNMQTPDSAGTMTAMITGAKTSAGIISLDKHARRADPESCNGHQLKSLLAHAEEQGWATGIVTTTTLTHATPAAGYAHSPERDWESDSDMPQQALARGCRDIASQLLSFSRDSKGGGLEVALGGGRANFLPNPEPGQENRRAKRLDGRDLTKEWSKGRSQARYVSNAKQLDNVNTANTRHLLGLFANSHLNFEADRATYGEGEPSLTRMVEVALDMLSKHENFLLVVEGGRIDHAHHAGNAYRALAETIEFDRAIKLAYERVNPLKTLMIVTADHSHTLTMSGYPTRGNPILGFVKSNDNHGEAESDYALAEDQQPYTTLGYANGRGYSNAAPDARYGFLARYVSPIQAGRHTSAEDDPTTPQYHQEVTVPLQVETHGGDDVAIYAQGPWAHLLNGVVEQNYLFHVMKHAGGL